jgi:hypothetical protein
VKDPHSPTADEHSLAFGLKPRPGGNPPGIPPDYLYDPDLNLYLNPRNPDRFMKPREPSNNPPGIPPEFVYDPEYDAYFPPGTPGDLPPGYLRRLREEIEKARNNGEDPHLVFVDELRAAGALDVPPAWRKSLSDERDLFSELNGDDNDPEAEEPTNSEPEDSA